MFAMFFFTQDPDTWTARWHKYIREKIAVCT